MNNMNSVLIEGELEADPEAAPDPSGGARTTFTVVSEHVEKRGAGGPLVERVTVRCVTHTHLAEICAQSLKKGRGVRVLGRLARDGEAYMRIEVEHIEFKPYPKREGEVAE